MTDSDCFLSSMENPKKGLDDSERESRVETDAIRLVDHSWNKGVEEGEKKREREEGINITRKNSVPTRATRKSREK